MAARQGTAVAEPPGDGGQVLFRAGASVQGLRQRMHDTWLFFYVFLTVWVVVLAWGLMERNRLKLSLGRSEVYWMGWMSLSVVTSAILYGMGTNGLLARRYPRAVGISDALAIGFVLALPVFAWSRLHREKVEEEPDGEDPAVLHRRLFTTLHLDLGEPIVPLNVAARTAPAREPQMDVVAQAFAPMPTRTAVVTIDGVIEATRTPQEEKKPTLGQAILRQEGAAQPMNHDLPPLPVSQPTSSASTLAVPEHSPEQPSGTLAFREQLRVLNESWARIEERGKEIEGWFDHQRQQAIARLERHPGVRQTDAPAEMSRDFLNEKLAAVDAEWAAIRKAAHEISQWFGDVPEKS